MYLHPITDSGTIKAFLRSVHMIQHLCGVDALASVRLVTTKWDQLQGINEGVKREGELGNKCRRYIDNGLQIQGFEYTYSSAWLIINSLSTELKFETAGQRRSSWFIHAARIFKDVIHRFAPSAKKFSLSQRNQMRSECQALLSKVINDTSAKVLVAKLTNGDAQAVADFLNAASLQ